MPLFEFECLDCENTFEDLVRSNNDLTGVICPICGSDITKKKISTFASRVAGAQISGSTNSSYSAPTCSSGST